MKAIIGLGAVLALLIATPVFADLHNPANRADYLIISSDSLIRHTPWIGDLATWRNAHGRTAMTVSTDSIWHEFGNGAPSDTVLKDFLFYADRQWQPPHLKDVFFVGWHDVVPSHVEPDSMFYTDSLGQRHYSHLDYLSDLFYAVNYESNNYQPVINVGRLPWSRNDTIPLTDFRNKIIAYETAPQEIWQTRIQVIADQQDVSFNFVANYAEPFVSHISAGYEIERDYLDYPAGDPWHGDRAEIIANFNAGNFLTAFFGHGGPDVWSIGNGLNFLESTTFDSLTNAYRLPIVLGFSYDSGINGNYRVGRLVRSLTLNINGGAIAYFGSTNVSWAVDGLNLREKVAHFATVDSTNTVGDIWRLSVQRFMQEHPENYGHAVYSPLQETAFAYTLFGDPGLRLPPRPSFAEERAPLLPEELRLIGNYPNPFNASTRIAFELNRDARVSLKVMDILGRETATLVDGFTSAGRHDVAWNAGNIPTGVYFVVLTAGDGRRVSKMLLLK